MQLIVFVLTFLCGYFLHKNGLNLSKQTDSWFDSYSQLFIRQFEHKDWSRGWLGLVLYMLLPAIVMTAFIQLIGDDKVLAMMLIHSIVLLVCVQPSAPLFRENTDEVSFSKDEFNIIQLASVIFWYLFLGPVGAIVARLAYETSLPKTIAQNSSKVRHYISWIPCRCLILSYALVGNFGRVIAQTQDAVMSFDQCHDEMEAKATLAAIWPELNNEQAVHNPALKMALYRRALLCWLTFVAISSLAL